MKKFIALLSVLIAFNLAEAQTFKVIKIQGKKAIVEVNDGEGSAAPQGLHDLALSGGDTGHRTPVVSDRVQM